MLFLLEKNKSIYILLHFLFPYPKKDFFTTDVLNLLCGKILVTLDLYEHSWPIESMESGGISRVGWSRVESGGVGWNQWSRVESGGVGWSRVESGRVGWSRVDYIEHNHHMTINHLTI